MANSAISRAAKSTNAASELFRDCESVAECLSVLAEFTADAWTWRGEESDRMKAFEQRLAALELVHEDGEGGTYMLQK